MVSEPRDCTEKLVKATKRLTYRGRWQGGRGARNETAAPRRAHHAENFGVRNTDCTRTLTPQEGTRISRAE